MKKQVIFNFKSDISKVNIPDNLNNPFGINIPEIVRIAAKEFQEFIALESQKWDYDFNIQKGKMFGVLVVKKADNTYAYLGTISGTLPGNKKCDEFVPSIFDDSTDDFFINKGLLELTEVSNKIKLAKSSSEISELTESRKLKSHALQQRLFENYQFINLLGIEKNILQIFKQYSQRNPPSAAGECAAPKLLQHAIKQQLKPIAIAEFWWGNPPRNKEREHKLFYPACKVRCRPIFEFMLNDKTLFNQANEEIKHNIMQKHYELTDAEFEKEFSDCTLDSSLFSHQAHLRLAWIHITKYGVEGATDSIRDQLKKYVKSLGAEDKYNETVTIASLRAVNHFIVKSKSSSFSDFIKENKGLEDNFKGLLLSHYTTNIFESELARKEFIEPDLQTFNGKNL